MQDASASAEPYNIDADAIASAVLQRFARLPQNGKPRQESGDGVREWVPLAGIVVQDTNNTSSSLQCIALATGMKCLPASTVATANGTMLHDSHAEILSLRALNRYLLEECLLLSQSPSDPAHLLEPTPPGSSKPFRLRPGLKLHMYSSDCPCGDASMELVMSRQHDSTPWSAPDSEPTDLLGRGHFSLLGRVRRKPARPDAPPTTSKSCSDKLALRQYTSLLSGLSSIFIDTEGAYLSSLVLPTSSLHHEAIIRAFSAEGRLRPLAQPNDISGFSLRPFAVLPTTLTFPFARADGARPAEKAIVSVAERHQVVINGVLQGRRKDDHRAAAELSRRRMWELAREVATALMQRGDARECLALLVGARTYADIKDCEALAERRTAKKYAVERALQGWNGDKTDRDWGLDSRTGSSR
ncbi:hypothetical protein ANO11243_062580 [Dothideomycetidae sp. 11243]|nr:hypothetical protein ANO11243_062580 [fungal sp. No.11243]